MIRVHDPNSDPKKRWDEEAVKKGSGSADTAR